MVLNWWKKLTQAFQRPPRGTSSKRSVAPSRRRRQPLWIEALEDRVTPATTITIMVGLNGSGSLDSTLIANNGVIAITDGSGGGTNPETLSTGALDSLSATTNINITARTAIVFNTIGGILSLPTGAGNSDSFTAQTGAITFNSPLDTLATSGASLSLNANTSLTLANLSAAGGITLLASSFTFPITINSGTAITTLGNSVAGTPINLGSGSVAGSINLTQADLDTITASNLRIGTPTAGAITISNAITTANAPGNINGTLSLINNGTITETTSPSVGTITANNLSVSSTGPVTLSNVNAVGNLSADTTGAFFINNGTSTLTIPNAGVDGVLGVTTSNSNITLQADNISIKQVVTPGPNSNTTNPVLLEPFTTTLNITVGTASVPLSTFGITNGGLGWITSGITQIGVGADTGTIAITGAINRTPTATAPSRSQILSLVTGNTTSNPLVSSITGAITQTAPLSVAKLQVTAVGGVQLTNAANDVDTIAGTITGTVLFNDNFRLVDAPTVTGTTLTVGSVASVSGITTVVGTGIDEFVELTTTAALTLANAITAGDIGLDAGGAVTQGGAASAAFTNVANLELLGMGPYTLNNTKNATAILAAVVTNAVNYTNAASLTVFAINYADGFGGLVTGITTTNAPITLNTVDGVLTVAASNPVNAGSSTVSLTAGSVADNQLLDVEAAVTGTGGVTLTGDNMTINAAVNAGSATALVQPFSSAQQINLGGSNGTGTLGLASAEINDVTAGILQIGNNTAGTLTISAPINPIGTHQLELLTGANIVNTATSPALTVTGLALSAGTGAGTSTTPLTTAVSSLAATVSSGGLFVSNTGALLVGTVSGVAGITVGGGTVNVLTTGALTLGTAGESLTASSSTVSLSAAGVSEGTGSIITASSLLLQGTGAFALANANAVGTLAANVTGAFTFNGGSSLTVGTVLSTSGIADNNAVTLTATTLTITGGIAVTGSAGVNLNATTLTVNGPAINQGSGALTVTVTGTTSTINALITGVGGSLVANGAGTLTLTGTDSYTGTTTVSTGTLIVNGTLASGGGVVTVNASGTLGGNGTIQRNLSVAGTLTPGTSTPGILTVNSVAFVAGSKLAVILNGPTAGTGYSQLVVTTGPVNLGTTTLHLTGGFAATGGSVVTLIKNQSGSPVSSTSSGLADGAAVIVGSFSGFLTYEGNTGNDVTLTTLGPVSFTSGVSGTVFTLRKSGVDLQLLENGTLTDARPLAAITSDTLNGAASVANNLQIDLGTGGFFTVSGGIFFNGGTSGSNAVQVLGGNLSAANLTFSSGTAGTGVLLPASGSGLGFVFSTTQFVDLTNNTISQLSFNLPAASSQVAVTDAGDGKVSGLASNNGTFVPTQYKDPSSALLVFAGGGGNGIHMVRTAATQAAYVLDGGAGHNGLGLDLSNTAANDVDFVTSFAVSSETLGGAIYYQATGGDFSTGGVTLALGSGNDFVSVESTTAKGQTVVRTGNGNNTILVSSVPNTTTGLLNGLKGILTVLAGTGSNQLTLSNAAQTVANQYNITNNAISGKVEPFTVYYQGNFAAGINLVSGNASTNTFAITSASATDPTTVYGGANSTFDVAVTNTSGYQNLTVIGGSGTNTLGVFDTSGGATVTKHAVSGVGGTMDVTYQGGTPSVITYNEVQQIGGNVPIH